MKITIRHIVGIIMSLVLIILNIIFFRDSKVFFFFIGIALLVSALPFLVTVIIEVGREREKESMFLEFSRNLVESVKSGTPISRSIVSIKGKKYGSLDPYVDKLSNQISLGIPVKDAFKIFARDIGNKVISRSVALIIEAEEAGGKIDDILENVAKNVNEVEDIKKERKSGMYNTIVQLYIIFLVFLVIMLVLQIQFIPKMTESINMAGLSGGGIAVLSGIGGSTDTTSTNTIFIILILVQGLFAGFVIGKLSEGSIKAGIKHSAIIIALTYLITFGVKAFVSSPGVI